MTQSNLDQDKTSMGGDFDEETPELKECLGSKTPCGFSEEESHHKIQ